MVDATFATSFNDQWSKREMARLCQLKLDSSLPINPPRTLHRKAPNVESRILKVATIRWDFPQGRAGERSARGDKIAGQP